MSPKRQRARTSPHAFTVEFPQALDVRKDGDAWWLEVDGRELRLSNLNKVFWPDEGYTKGDLIAYYFNVAHLMLPHLSGRPLTMKRMPDGIDGPFFYEKSAPSHVPDWIGRCKVLSDDAKTGVIDYMTIEDAAGLLFIANLGCIEFHPLHSRCEDVEHPDYCFFDLDPFPPYTYEDVLTVARHIKALLDQLGLPGFPKTSGATGLQIFVPIERGRYTYDQVRELVGRCGRLILQADPDRVTMAWKIADRTGKTFIDHNMNRSGANIAAAYSLRPELQAPVSTPLTWDEVAAGGFEPQDFRIDNVWERFDRVGDLFAGMRTEAADLTSAFEALGIDPTDQAGERADANLGGDHRGLEGPEPGRVHPQAGLRGDARAGAGQRRGAGQLVRDPQAPSDAAALRRALGAERRAAVLGGPEGPADGEGRQAARGSDRGSSRWSTGSSKAPSRRATTAPERCGSSTTAGTSRSSGTTRRRSRSSCTGGAIRAWSSTSSRPARTGSRSWPARRTRR